MESRFRVLIIGGYGTFGQRIAKALSRDDKFDLLIAGRSLKKAQAFCSELQGEAAASQPLCLDIGDRHALTECLATYEPSLVIHTSGPFQGQAPLVAQACISVGIHYIDLADGRDFVTRFSTLDAAARAHNVLAVTGASSVPGLSSAVIDQYLPQFSRLDTIDFGINPGNQTPRGEATVAAILSYCGKPFMRWEKGAWRRAYGWQDLTAVTYPGAMGRRWFANCDIPDLQLFPSRYPAVRNVIFRAGLELPLLHFGTWMLSWFSRSRIVRNWAKYSSELKQASEWFLRFGSTKGGMHLILKGLDQAGCELEKRWYILAEQGDGPQIPCTAAVVLAKKLARGTLTARGAMPCMGLFTLSEFMEELADFAIWSVEE